ncbi:multidrug efflux RND transporter periplasmic adaptor subunit MexA [Pseudomonas aeruginosa]|nr:multidrug efflux RND transporter periplasmic adaptor subunit MexA [Pseudomonas aeruginosa]MBG5256281.1 multidrug efflux RND transporter periplasmic adaptor subunit MexA [Pseudomonas aeruginosa]MBG5393907.1 multidrug efflux RND transporter periplasmic adaptor subunit MexA [Pseudomonas aeruginosa]MBI8692497.1 multidrug efflux RND transporter periplasmic adaptor subunit MexA [Pseudomonas aeruginosa]HCG0519436.1 multidrug efflux RND transporter periplasmic adaptor subunit MexA [Pseudomonas aerug
MQRTPAMRVLVPALLVAISALSGCGKSEAPPPAQTPEVGIVTLEAQTVTLNTELPGRTNAFRIAEVRPQVNGIILKRLFKEGSDVKAGQQLYQIDPATYEADYQSAQANLASTQEQAQRYKLLVADQAVSKQQYADANAAYLQSKAAVEQARINLRYTKVLSPISGRIGRSAVTEGALVTNGQANAMATVQQLDPIYVDVTQPSTALLRLRRELASGQLERAGDNAAKVSLKLEDGSQYPLEGRLEFSEVSVDEGTGSVTIRAVFPNPNNELLPGMFVHAQLQEGVKQKAILAPQQGVTRDLKGQATALVVNAQNKVELRVIKADRVIGDKWLVTEGLNAGDKIITEGLQFVQPGDRAGEECRVRAEGRRRSGENRQQGLIKGIRNVEVFH